MGYYIFTNKENGNQYVGSSIDLRTRLQTYLHGSVSSICRALAKYGHSSFSLTIFYLNDADGILLMED
ncbi:hypothetical protein BJ741DRAFT_542528 [Chytriomyces cf. hyalinus JEL632]|nr:hypothetical protein BJ741DRAFT_542528 [Chytriomyces cf. hyalinus JEL632]